MDKHGTQIQATFFKDACDKFETMIHGKPQNPTLALQNRINILKVPKKSIREFIAPHMNKL